LESLLKNDSGQDRQTLQPWTKSKTTFVFFVGEEISKSKKREGFFKKPHPGENEAIEKNNKQLVGKGEGPVLKGATRCVATRQGGGCGKVTKVKKIRNYLKSSTGGGDSEILT